MIGFRGPIPFVWFAGIFTGPPPPTVGFKSAFGGWVGGGGVGGVTPPTPEEIKTGTGGIDPGDGLRIYKPTGLEDRKKRVDQRVDESSEIHAEVAAKLAKELRDSVDEIEVAELKATRLMTSAEVDQEIGMLLRKQLRTEEEELLLILLLAVA